MKKIKKIIALVLAGVILFGGVVMGATGDSTSDSFTVTTTIQGINKIKITTAEVSNYGSFDSATPFTNHLVSEPKAQTINAWLSVATNNRAGYTITMGATPMTSTLAGQATSYIDYTVTVNNIPLKTTGATEVNPVEIINVSGVTGMTISSIKIDLWVDKPTFVSAVEGEYTGIITFNYTAK